MVGNPYGLFNDFEWISLDDYPFYWVWNINHIEHTIIKGYKLESFNIVFDV